MHPSHIGVDGRTLLTRDLTADIAILRLAVGGGEEKTTTPSDGITGYLVQ